MSKSGKYEVISSVKFEKFCFQCVCLSLVVKILGIEIDPIA